MDGRVDWLTWTQKPAREPENIQELYHIARRAMRELSDEHEQWIFNGQGFDRTARQANFSLCIQRDDHGIYLAGQSPTGHIMVTATGRACDAIVEPDRSRRIVTQVAELVTRFDYAVDVSTECLPGEFANARTHQAFRSISFIRSDSGETAYIGSPKSDRFARVYRYNPPHPRAHLLRVEFVFRRGLARAAAVEYSNTENGAHFIAKLGNTWGFSHPVWRPGDRTDERIVAPSVDRRTEDTIAWLYKQVTPAVRRVMFSGGFDPADWIQTWYTE